MPPVTVGDPAPDVTFRTQDGATVRLADFRGKRPVVVFFYPKDGTPICTQEACAFRDAYGRFTDSGAEVIGVSADSDATHRSFAAKHKLPYLLASDSGGDLRRAFGVPRTLGIFPGRVTYVIDAAGVVRLVFSAQMTSIDHVTKALEALADREPGDAPAR